MSTRPLFEPKSQLQFDLDYLNPFDQFQISHCSEKQKVWIIENSCRTVNHPQSHTLFDYYSMILIDLLSNPVIFILSSVDKWLAYILYDFVEHYWPLLALL